MHSGVSVLGGDAERSAEECGGGGAGVEVQDEKLGGAVEGGELLLVHMFVEKLLTCLTCPLFFCQALEKVSRLEAENQSIQKVCLYPDV